MATFDQVTEMLDTKIKNSFVLNLFGGICAGAVSTIVGCPMDNIKTRIMNQQKFNGKGIEYSGMLDCFVKSIKKDGFWRL